MVLVSQKERDEISTIVALRPLRVAGVRVPGPEPSNFGRSPRRDGGTARKDRHSALAVKLARPLIVKSSVRLVNDRDRAKILREATCDQHFFPQPIRVRTQNPRRFTAKGTELIVKGLILAQNERWRRGLGMQVERAARPVA